MRTTILSLQPRESPRSTLIMGLTPRRRGLSRQRPKTQRPTLYAHWLKEVHARMLEQLKETREAMSKYYDRMRLEPPPFKVGDKVLLQGKNLKTKRPSKKLGHKMEGPFPIVKFIGTHAVKLKLPKMMKCHNVFHISLLEPYRVNALEERRPVRLEPIEVEGEEEWQVERIIRSEWRQKRRNGPRWVEFLTQWKGYPIGEATWENIDAFRGGSKHFLRTFYAENPTMPWDPAMDLEDSDVESDSGSHH